MQISKCAILAGILMSEWRSAPVVMKKAGSPLGMIARQHRLVGSADFVPNRSCGD
jgi:hypothetical protein